MMYKHSRFGFTLVEVVVAMFIVALAVLGVTMIVTQTIRANGENQRSIEATQIAEHLIETTLAALQNDNLDTLTCPGNTNGTTTGNSGTEYQTILELTPQRLDLNTGQYTALTDCTSTDLYKLDVTVVWEGGQNVHLTTLTSSDPTYEPHPVINAFYIGAEEKLPHNNVCASTMPDSIHLEWAVYAAETVTIQVGESEPIPVDHIGLRDFDITETTVFTLSATNGAGNTVKEQRTAIVDAVPLINTFAFNPNPTLEGVPSTLSWNTTDAQAVLLNDEPVTTSGTRSTPPIDGTIATLRLINGACSIDDTISTPLAIEPLKILDFKADHDTITEGESVTLGWAYNHALHPAHHTATLTNNRDSTTPDVSNTTYQQAKADGPTTYTLTLTDKNGNVIDAATTTVETVPPARIDSFNAQPAQVCGPQPINVTWSAVNATQVTLMPMAINVTSQTTANFPIDATSDIYLIAKNQVGHQTESNRITITHTPTPTITLTSDKHTINQGDTLTLAWEVTDAQTITINDQPVANAGAWILAPTTTTTYTHSASNGNCAPIEDTTAVIVEPLKITSATITPTETTEGEEVTLNWTLNNAFDPNLHHFIIEPNNTAAGNNTSLAINAAAAGTTSYTIVAYDHASNLNLTPEAPDHTTTDRELARSQPVTLTTVEKPIVDVFTVEPLFVCGPAPVTAAWQTRHAETLLLNGEALAPASAGSTQVNITNNTPTLILEAKNRLGYAVHSNPITIAYYDIPTGTLTADHEAITAGQTTNLHWNTQHTTNVTLDGQLVDPTNTLTVTPLKTTTYVLELTNGPDCTPIRMEQQVTVHPVEVNSFTTDHSDITRGESTTLRWNITNLDPTLHKVTLHPLNLDVTALTSQVVSSLPPRERYTLTVHERNQHGRELATSKVVTIVVDEAPTITSFTADPIGVCAAGTTNLTWATEHATRVMLDNVNVAANNPLGSEVEINGTRTFTLRAENRLAYPDTAQVTVHQAPKPVVTFAVDKARIPEGDTITLTWSVVDADHVTLNGERVEPVGNRTLTPREVTTYSLAATKDNAAGSEFACVTLREVTVQVDPVSIKRFGLTSNTEVTRGDILTLPWELEGPFTPTVHTLTLATQPNGEPNQSIDVTSLTQLDVRPQSDTTYHLTLRGAVGQVLHMSSVQALILDPPVITSFTADRQQVCGAGNITFSWVTTGATSAFLNGQPLNTPSGGTTTRTVDTTETLELEIRNSLGASTYAYQTITARPAPTATLETDNTSVPTGAAATITWHVQHAHETTLNGERVEPSGSLTITPTTTQVFSLAATTDNCATITRELVIEPQPVNVTNLQAAPTEISAGSETTLTWSTNGYHPELHQVILEPTGQELTNGTHTIAPSETTTYRASVRLRANPETVLATSNPVTVTVAPQPLIDALRLEPAYSCTPNQTLTISWATRNATTAKLNGQTVQPNGSKQATGSSFILEATNALGQTVSQTTHALTAPERTVTFTASSERVLRGETTTLEWTAAGVHTASLDGQPVPLAGTLQVTPDHNTTYTLQTNTPNGALDCITTHLVTIAVDELAIESLTATPTSISAGGTATLTWETTSELDPDKHTLTLQPLGTNVTTLTQQQVNPTEPTSYWLELQDAKGRLIDRSDKVTIVIQGKPALTSASITPTEQCQAGNATITWSSVNSAHVLIDEVQRPAAGELTQPLATTRQFTLTPVDSLGNHGNTETLLARITPQPTLSLTANQTTISRGDTITLTWNAANAESVTLDGIHVPAQSTRTLKPNTTTTYRLEATTGDCITTRALTVTVENAHIDTFTADREDITNGDNVTLTWTHTGLNKDLHTLTLHPTNTELAHDANSVTIQPRSDTQHLLRITDQDGLVLAERRLQQPIRVHEAPIITNFAADQLLVYGEADVILRWGTRNASSVTINGTAVTPREAGAVTKHVTSSRTFTLAVTNPAGASATAAVTIQQADLPTASLRASQSTITAGDTSTLTWEATGDQVLLNGAAVPATSSMQVAPTRTTAYMLETRNASGHKATNVVTITVDQVRVESLTADPTHAQAGDAIRLTWQVTPTFDPRLHKLTLEPLGVDVTNQTTHTITTTTSSTIQLVITDHTNRELHRTQPGATITLGEEGAIASLTATTPTCTQNATRITWITRGATTTRLNGQTLDPTLTRRGNHTLTPAPTKITLEALNQTGNLIDTRNLNLNTPTIPTITQFRTNRAAALAGQTITLEWNVANATRITIDGIEVPAQGQATLAVTDTTTYTLHAESADGCNTTQRLTANAQHVNVENLTADKTTIHPGESVNLAWAYPVAPSYEHQVTLEGHGTLELDGATYPTRQSVTPTQTTTYSVAILDQNGRVLARSNTLTVEVHTQPEIISFDATPASVCGAGDTLLTWSTRNAKQTYLLHAGVQREITTAYGATALRVKPGNELTLTATAPHGDDTRSITIGGSARPNISFEVTPAHRVVGQSATITWNAEHATTVKLNGQTVNNSGTITDHNDKTTTYRLEVTTDDCNPLVLERTIHTASVHAYALTADRIHITEGDATALRWSLSDTFNPNTHQLILEPTGQDVTGQHHFEVSPADTTTYHLHITDQAGDTLATSPSVTITVEGMPVITSFDAAPKQVCGTTDTTFTWSTLNAARLLLNGTDVSPISSGSTTRHITRGGEYTLEAINPLGVTVTSDPITIQQADHPTTELTSNKQTIIDGDAVELTWQTTNAQTATLNGNAIATSGTLTVHPRQTTTYTLTANNPTAGTPCETTATVTITVQPLGIEAFTTTPEHVTVGHNYELEWSLTSTFNHELHIVRVDDGNDLGAATTLTRAADQSRTHTLELRRRHDNSLITSKSATVTVHAAPLIDDLTVSPAAICEGAQSTLTWATRHASNVTLNNQTVTASGTQTVHPSSSTNYELIATNPAGTTVQRRMWLTVNPQPAITFTTTKNTMIAGDTATLNWNIQNATSARLNGQVVPLEGSLEVDPLTTTSYTLSVDQITCGTTTRKITITVNDVNIQTLTATPNVVTIGDDSELAWTLSNTFDSGLHTLNLRRYEPAQEIGAVTGAKHTVTPNASGLNGYELRILDVGGRTLAARQVQVTATLAPIIKSFAADPAAVCVAPGQAGVAVPITLSWSRGGQWTTALINGQPITGNELTNNRAIRNATTSTAFTLEAHNAAYAHGSNRGATSAETTVPFTQVIAPTFTAAKTRITAGDTVTLTWSATGATTVELDGQAVNASGSLQVRPTSATTYTLTAQTGDCAPITQTITVTVDPVTVNTFSADATNVTSGAPVLLTWSLSSTYTTSLHKLVLQPLGTTVTGTNTTVHPTVTTTYRLRIDDNHGRTLARGPQVTVTANAAPTIESFTAAPQLVCGPNEITLTWATANAIALRLNGQELTPISNGTTTRTVTSTTTYTLAALNAAGGSVTEARTITYIDPLQASLTSNKTRIVRGDTTTLNWSVAAGNSITLNGQPVNPTGSREITPTETTTYTLVATSEHCGTTTRQTTIEVDPVTIDTFQLTNTNLLDQHGSYPRNTKPALAWTTTNHNPTLHKLELTTPSGITTPLAANGSWSDTTARTHTYVLTLYDKQRNILDRAELDTAVQPAITGSEPPALVCIPNALEIAWTVHDTQTYTVHQDGQLVRDADHTPGIVTENILRTLNITNPAGGTISATATNSLGSSVTRTATVQGTYPPQLTLQATPGVAGAPVTISWNVTHAPADGTITLDNQTVPATGDTTYALGNTTRQHTLRVQSDPCGTFEQTITVTPRTPDITTFTATPETITVGDTAQFTWATNTHYDPAHHRLELAAPTQDEPGRGDTAYDLGSATSQARKITKVGAHDYRLTIYSRHTGEQLATSSTSRVTGVHAPSISSFTANPTQVCSSSPDSTLTWATASANRVTISDLGTVSTSGNRVVTPNQTTAYTLTARNAANTTTTATAHITYTQAPEITSFTAQGPSANNNYVAAGKNYTLTWTMTDPNATPILDGVPQTAGSTSATRLAPNSPDSITHTLTLERGPCATTAASRTINPAVAPTSNPAPQASLTGDSQITLTWVTPAFNGNAPITSYGVHRLENDSISTTIYLDNVNSYVDDSVLPGNTYKYLVYAGNAAGLRSPDSPYSNEVTVIGAPGIPNAPIIQSIDDRSITIAWAPPTNNGGAQITRYQVERQDSSDTSTWGAWDTAAESHATTTFTDTGLTPGTYYRYRIAAANVTGPGPYSSASNHGRAITTPNAPGEPNANVSGNQTIAVSWSTPSSDGYSSIINYSVQHRTSSDNSSWGPWTTLNTTTGTSYSDFGLTTGAYYQYRIAATNAAGTGSYSSVTDSVRASATASAPTPSASASGDRRIDISWSVPLSDGGSSITGYIIRYRTSSDNSNWGSWITATITTDTSYVHTGLSAGTYYQYSAAAINAAGQGPGRHSNSVRAITTPSAPSTPNASAGNKTMSLSWDAPSSDGYSAITGYSVQYKGSSNAAPGKNVSGTITHGSASQVNDGVRNVTNNSGIYVGFGEKGPGANGTNPESGYIQIDLGSTMPVSAVHSYFYAYDSRHYWYKVKASVDGSNWTYLDGGPSNTEWVTSPNSSSVGMGEYFPTLTTSTTPINARYVRLYADGSTANGGNHVYEIDVFVDYIDWTTANGNVGSSRSYTVTGLTEGRHYQYRIAAINGAGASPYSAPSTSMLAIAPPSAPNAPSVTPGDRRAIVSWNTPDTSYSTITGYQVQRRSSTNGTNWTTWATVMPHIIETNWANTGLTAGTYYQYRVAAVNAAGSSAFSNAGNSLLAITTPNAPRTASASTTTTANQLTVTWAAPATCTRNQFGICIQWETRPEDTGYGNITGYEVQRRSSTNGSNWSAWTTVVAQTTVTSWTNSGLTGSYWYQYRIRAKSAAGGGEWSAPTASRRPSYARNVAYAPEWLGTFCNYRAPNPPLVRAIYGDNLWHSTGRLTWSGGWGCGAWADIDIAWNNQAGSPAPQCRVTASNQSAGGWRFPTCRFQ